MIRLGTDIFHAVLLSLQSKDLIQNIFFSEIDTQQIHVLIRHILSGSYVQYCSNQCLELSGKSEW